MSDDNIFVAYYFLPPDLVSNALIQSASRIDCRIVQIDSNYRIQRGTDGIVPGFENKELKYYTLLQGKASWISSPRSLAVWIFYAKDVTALAISPHDWGQYVWQGYIIQNESRTLIEKISKEIHKIIMPQSPLNVLAKLGRPLVIHKAPTEEEDKKELEKLEEQANAAIQSITKCNAEGNDPKQYIRLVAQLNGCALPCKLVIWSLTKNSTAIPMLHRA